MSAGGAQVAVLGVREQRASRRGRDLGERPQLIRLLAFGALGLYGTVRWSKLLAGGGHGRLIAILGLALLLTAARGPLAGRSRPLAWLFTVLVLLAVFPVAGLPWQWVLHLRLASSARAIGDGLSALPQTLVPYRGTNQWVRLDVVLGGAVLLFDAGLLLAFAPRRLDDLRRAGAALPLVALVAVPSTLVHPRFPYLNGLLLFLMLAAFVLADRITSRQSASALGLCLLTSIAAMLFAPALARDRPWLDYQALAGTLNPKVLEAFNWTQTYGPVTWPQRGRTVLEIQAREAEYWKAEDLDVFDGRAWTQGSVPGRQRTPAPAASSIAAWSQTIQVTLRDMRTSEVIGAGVSSRPTHVPDRVASGFGEGTWTTSRELSPGQSYTVRVYAPKPTAGQLSRVGPEYAGLPAGYRTVRLPVRPGPGAPGLAQVVFPAFGHSSALGVVRTSVYGPAYRLAQRLARGAPTPYAFVLAVGRYLAHGYTYSQSPPVRAYPLESFLFQDKSGYCQQFAGAMALLLRMGGIPARVAVGFTPGREPAGIPRWLVTDTDAHAWVEVWFARFGWVRFDPTPPVDPALSGLTPAASASFSSSVGSANVNSRHVAGAASSRTRAAPRHHPRSRSTAGTWEAIAGGAAVVLAALVVLWLATRPLDGAAALVAELERALTRVGRPLAPGATLTMLHDRVRGSPRAGEYIRLLCLSRYAGSDRLPTLAQRRALRRQLAAGRGPVGVLRALWALPPRRRRVSHGRRAATRTTLRRGA